MSLPNVEVESFEYVDLNTIDPNMQPVPEDFYTFKVMKAEKKGFQYKQGDKAGQTGEMLKFQVAIVDHENFAGRRFFDSMFPGNGTFRILRRLMDATGVRQEPGTVLDEWLRQLTEIKPEFKMKAEKVEDVDRAGNARSLGPDGKPAIINKLNWWSVAPV